ncbi:2-oxo-4-hydroxy-4-carboxy-5-ureidoimidazoline decarboxylase [Pelagibius sp. Alg239-R121]|uniref:2-oxo-4-hydroxy-4-carboxy-5-ureidoimidazoline decarboxylase n=1 Tax=Pelagibius sp. Alg239-R121 TaxID=2993448 RepID=UPI0024A7719B|nr:2-oxo-4-hydroxy-4-carboxy-5-ureidoimidazoline decarboxylase [Pelagibius sp. Alg239-R121]
MTVSLAQINSASQSEFLSLLGGVTERLTWVVETVAGQRPFKSVEELSASFETTVRAATERRLDLLQAHPELAGSEALAGGMTAESNGEQSRLGLLALSADNKRALDRLNAAYRMRFGFPFIIALHRQPDLAAVLAEFERRLAAAPEDEAATAVDEIVYVMRNRIEGLFLASCSA